LSEAKKAARAWVGPATMTLVLLIGLNLLNYIDRYILPGEVSLIQRELHSTDAQMGALTTALFLTYMIAAPLTGEIGGHDHYCPVRFVRGGAT
jgi:MFS family permease